MADRKTAVWFFVQNDLSFHVLSVCTRPQLCSSWFVHNTYVMGNRRRNMATKLRTDRSRETLWQTIIRGKLVLCFKSSGKLKNKWPVGGRLWILFESTWLKIKVIICTIIISIENFRSWSVLCAPICRVISARSRGCPITGVWFKVGYL